MKGSQPGSDGEADSSRIRNEVHHVTDEQLADAPVSMNDLRQRLRDARARLNAVLDPLTDEQLTGPRDDGGWTVKDHVVNIALWERSIVNLLRGVPRYEALGVDRDTYNELDEHGLNAIMVAEWRERPLREVRALYRDTHHQTLHLLDTLTWDDLLRPYSDFLPDEPGEAAESVETSTTQHRPVLWWVLGNTAEHYDQHRRWIEELMTRDAASTS
jgi:hypothetical protein